MHVGGGSDLLHWKFCVVDAYLLFNKKTRAEDDKLSCRVTKIGLQAIL